MHIVAMYLHVGWPAASIPAMFFFHRWCMMRFILPGGLKVVCAPQGVLPEIGMSVLAWDSLTCIRMRRLQSGWGNVGEIAERPMAAAPPAPQKAITLMGSSLILPLRINAFRPAAEPSAAEPLLPSWVCIQGTTQEVL